MQQLYANSAGDSPTTKTLGRGQTSQVIRCNSTHTLLVKVSGTFDSQTVTMEESSDGGVTWATYAIDVNGTQVSQTWTGTNATGDTNLRGFKAGGQQFRWSVGGSLGAGSAAVKVEAYHKCSQIERKII